MPFIRSSAFKRWAKLVSTIILLGEIMPSYSRCIKRRLLCVVIAALSSRQSSFYAKYIQANIRSFCNIYLVFNAEYIFLAYLINF